MAPNGSAVHARVLRASGHGQQWGVARECYVIAVLAPYSCTSSRGRPASRYLSAASTTTLQVQTLRGVRHWPSAPLAGMP
eukprot:7553000-Pyramimonas_sp.AAC.1